MTPMRVELPSGRRVNVLASEMVRLTMGDIAFVSFQPERVYLFTGNDERTLLVLAA
jgi:hypothetical protein